MTAENDAFKRRLRPDPGRNGVEVREGHLGFFPMIGSTGSPFRAAIPLPTA